MNEPTRHLYEACATGDIHKIREALARGGDVNSQTWESRFTPLHVCIAGVYGQEARAEIVKALCAAGARPDLTEIRGLTPLQYAATRNKSHCAAALLECGAGVHTAGADGATALHHAAYGGHMEVAQVLVRHGAEATRRDASGITPLDLANAEGHVALAQWLSTPPPPPKKPLWRRWI